MRGTRLEEQTKTLSERAGRGLRNGVQFRRSSALSPIGGPNSDQEIKSPGRDVSIAISDAEFTGAGEERRAHTSEEGKEGGGGWLSLFMEQTALGITEQQFFG